MTDARSAPPAGTAAEDAPFDHQPTALLGARPPLTLDCGEALGPFPVAYQTYGTPNDARSNAILVCHALTGDQYVAGNHPVTGRAGWWDHMIGPGRVLDTNRYFIICANVIGGCMGSAGAAHHQPATGAPYELTFPVITIGDMVRAQAMLLDHLGIDQLFCVIGGSMGGMQALEWASRYPERVFASVPIAAAARPTAQNIAFHEVGRQAIKADPDWQGGDYTAQGARPHLGLAVARMVAHITYLSDAAFHSKFGRMLQDSAELTYGFEAEFQVESYLRHQGSTFVDRFDANAYLYITRAMDYFDLAEAHGGSLARAFADTPVRFCVISFSSDWLFPTPESRAIVHALNANAANVSFVEIESDRGHDSFLLDVPEFFSVLRGFLNGAAGIRGLAPAMSAPDVEVAEWTNGIRVDLRVVAEMVESGSRVLDVGCGDGALLRHLVQDKGADARGIEISNDGVSACLRQGLSVLQGDADTDLDAYPSKSFDFVIMSQTIQATRAPLDVLRQLVRIGRFAIVSFPNFGYWRCRLQLLLGGRMPVTGGLPLPWHTTANIHFCTVADFIDTCRDERIEIVRSHVIDGSGHISGRAAGNPTANFAGEHGIFLLSRSA